MGFIREILSRSNQTERETAAKTRRHRRSAEEELNALRVRWLKDLRRTNPMKFNRIMESEFQGESEIDRVVQALNQLKGADLIDDPKNVGAASWVRDLVPALAPVLAAALAQPPAAATRPIQPDAVVPMAAPVGTTGHGLPTPPPVATTGHGVPTPPAPEAQAAQRSGGFAGDLVSGVILRQIAGKSPEQAAEMLCNLTHPLAQTIVQLICQTPNANLPAALDSFAQSSPPYAKLVAWLVDNWEWTLAAACHIRRLNDVPCEMG